MAQRIKLVVRKVFKTDITGTKVQHIPMLEAPVQSNILQAQKVCVPRQLSISSISDLPDTPAVYALYGRSGRYTYVAYVGSTRCLKTRIQQHLISRDGGISTSTSAVSLNPDHVTQVRWWRKEDFRNPQKRRAAESLAAEELKPVLRTRDLIPNAARVYLTDAEFCSRIGPLFKNEPTGCLIIPSLAIALERITELEQRISNLVERVNRLSPRR